MADLHGYSIYSTPGGGTVTVNIIADYGKSHGTFWEDIVCVGPVLQQLERHLTESALRSERLSMQMASWAEHEYYDRLEAQGAITREPLLTDVEFTILKTRVLDHMNQNFDFKK